MSQAYIDFAFVKENASFERILSHYARGHGRAHLHPGP
jgi:hypothetical protein